MKRAEKNQQSQKLQKHYGPTSCNRDRRTTIEQREGGKERTTLLLVYFRQLWFFFYQSMHPRWKDNKCRLFSFQVLHPSPSPLCSVSESMRVNGCCHVVLSWALLLGNPQGRLLLALSFWWHAVNVMRSALVPVKFL